MTLTALEFYSGIGGLHLALQRTGIVANLLLAFDWDQSARRVYSLNHPGTPVKQADICTLSASQLPDADIWLLSPSCQPYTVLNPAAKADADPRARPFLHIVHTILPELADKNALPRYLLVENVAGFETSSTRSGLLARLGSLGYVFLELLLTPLQFGIPNSRLRYYLLAKLPPLGFPDVPSEAKRIWRHIPGRGVDWLDPRSSEVTDLEVHPIRYYLDDLEDNTGYKIPTRVLEKWGRLFDIVTPSSSRSCCFTRGYAKLVEGTGSVLQMNENLPTHETFEKFLQAQAKEDPSAVQILDSLQLRYFSPTELLRLFGFQRRDSEDDFKWPSELSSKSKYRLIGNSVNVDVVAKLVQFLLQ